MGGGGILLSHPLPPDLLTQWGWFVKGRWPCAYAVRTEEEGAQFKAWYTKGYPAKGLVAHLEDNPGWFRVF